ncbi:MAG: TolC family protein [Gemmatimonadaceae bacterium]
MRPRQRARQPRSIAARSLQAAALLSLLLAPTLLVPALLAAQPSLDRPISIGDAARIAARQSAFTEQARLRAEQADARVTQRRAELLPNLSAAASQGGRTFNTATFGIDFRDPASGATLFDPNGEVLGPVNLTEVRGRVSQAVFDVGAIARVRSARASASAADAAATDAAEQAAAAGAVAYLRALRAEAEVRARGADSVLADSLLLIARDLLSAGVGVGLDVTRAQAQLANVRAQLIVARNARDRARLDLLRALNLPLDTPVRLADSLGALPVPTDVPAEAAAIERALRSRPDLAAADRQVRAAEQALSAIRAERLPTVGVFADDGFIGKGPSHLLHTYTWGLQLSFPIFEGFRREGRLGEQRALERELDVRRRDLRQQTSLEVRGALLDFSSAREQIAAARERLALAEQEIVQARDRFRAGVAGNADVITASLSLTGARTLLIDAQTSYQAARISLARAQGAVRELP